MFYNLVLMMLIPYRIMAMYEDSGSDFFSEFSVKLLLSRLCFVMNLISEI